MVPRAAWHMQGGVGYKTKKACCYPGSRATSRGMLGGGGGSIFFSPDAGVLRLRVARAATLLFALACPACYVLLAPPGSESRADPIKRALRFQERESRMKSTIDEQAHYFQVGKEVQQGTCRGRKL